MIHEHHRKRRRGAGTDNRPVNVIRIPDVLHEWIHANPQKAREAGLLVDQHANPEDVQITIPEEALKKMRKQRAERKEPSRNRTVVGIRVPKDDQEDGAGVWDDYCEAGRELGEKAEFGWSETVPDYTVAMFFFGYGLLRYRDALESGEDIPVPNKDESGGEGQG